MSLGYQFLLAPGRGPDTHTGAPAPWCTHLDYWGEGRRTPFSCTLLYRASRMCFLQAEVRALPQQKHYSLRCHDTQSGGLQPGPPRLRGVPVLSPSAHLLSSSFLPETAPSSFVLLRPSISQPCWVPSLLRACSFRHKALFRVP